MEEHNSIDMANKNTICVDSGAALELNESILSNISDDRDRWQDTHEAIFIPLSNSNMDILKKTESELIGETKLNSGKCSRSPVRTINKWPGRVRDKLYKKNSFYEKKPEHKNNQNSKFKPKAIPPKVIVETLPGGDIRFSDFAAFKLRDSDSDDELQSDDMDKTSSSLYECDEIIDYNSGTDMNQSLPEMLNDIPEKQCDMVESIPESVHIEEMIENPCKDNGVITDSSVLYTNVSQEHVQEIHASEVKVQAVFYKKFTGLSTTMTPNICKKTKSQRNVLRNVRRRLALQCNVSQGKGIKLKDIPCIEAEVLVLPAENLITFHSILFDVPGSFKRGVTNSRAKSNILNFNGFPFSENSSSFALKKYRLNRMHFQCINEVAQLLFGMEHHVKRADLVTTIMNFLIKPSRESAEEMRLPKRSRKQDFDLQCHILKELILRGGGLIPQIVVKKLTPSELNRYLPPTPQKSQSAQNEVKEDEIPDTAAILEKNHSYPAYLDKLIRNSSHSSCNQNRDITANDASMQNLLKEKVLAVVPAVRQPIEAIQEGKMLKFLPGVIDRINAAEERVIHLLHGLLFASLEKVAKARQNILEFSGFRNFQQFLDHRRKFLQHSLLPEELKKICEILAVRYDKENVSSTIDNILEFLRVPCEKLQDLDSIQPSPTLNVVEKQLEKELQTPLSRFEDIRFNIECATPDELMELHDIMYLEPCDTFEIHQRILKFSGFSFNINSPEYYTRKTLMSYMTLNCLRRITQFLNLKSLHFISNKDEMIAGILKFLLEPKVPANDALLNKAHIVMLKNSPNNATPSSSQIEYPRPISVPQHHQDSVANVSNSAYYITPSESYSSSSEDEAENNIPLLAFVSHPSNGQLKKDIQEVMKVNKLTITMNGLIDSVLSKYPGFDLKYRKKFIKSKARKILSCIQKQRLTEPSAASSQPSSSCLSICLRPASQFTICSSETSGSPSR